MKNTLTGKQKSFLRSMGAALEPVIHIGKGGLTPPIVSSAIEVIRARELVKVRVLQNCLEEPEEVLTVLAERTRCDLVQVIGRNGLLYRANPEKPKIELP